MLGRMDRTGWQRSFLRLPSVAWADLSAAVCMAGTQGSARPTSCQAPAPRGPPQDGLPDQKQDTRPGPLREDQGQEVPLPAAGTAP